MAKKTELKITTILNDIYLKSKSKLSFNVEELRDHHKIGRNLFTILKKKNLINKLSPGEYIYIGNTPTINLCKTISNEYAKYNRNLVEYNKNKRMNDITLFGEKIPKEYPKKEKPIETNKISKLTEVRSKVAENKRIINIIQDNVNLILKSELSKINDKIIELKEELNKDIIRCKDGIYHIENYQEQKNKSLQSQIENIILTYESYLKKPFITKLFS